MHIDVCYSDLNPFEIKFADTRSLQYYEHESFRCCQHGPLLRRPQASRRPPDLRWLRSLELASASAKRSCSLERQAACRHAVILTTTTLSQCSTVTITIVLSAFPNPDGPAGNVQYGPKNPMGTQHDECKKILEAQQQRPIRYLGPRSARSNELHAGLAHPSKRGFFLSNCDGSRLSSVTAGSQYCPFTTLYPRDIYEYHSLFFLIGDFTDTH